MRPGREMVTWGISSCWGELVRNTPHLHVHLGSADMQRPMP